MSKRILLCLPLLMTLACDSGDESVEARSADEPSELASDEQGPPHGPREHGKQMVEHLCGELECSDEQREAIDELVGAAKRDHEGPDSAERDELHRAFADAFRGETLDLAALPQPSEDHHAQRRTEMATLIVGVHAILTAEQRDELATKIETGEGPFPMFGKHGGKRGGKRHHGPEGEGPEGEAREFDPAKHAERKVERLCELVTCSEAQQAQLVTVVSEELASMTPPAPPKLDDTAKARFATALRAESLTLAEVEALLDAMRPAKPDNHAEKHAQMGELMVAVHALLTPEQRAIVADEIAEKGPHALLGKGHGKRGHGKRGRGKQADRSE